MSEIDDLQRRVMAAMERVGRACDILAARSQAGPSGGTGLDAESDTALGAAPELAALEAALDEERTANAQLEARVRRLKERLRSQRASHAEELASAQTGEEDGEGGGEGGGAGSAQLRRELAAQTGALAALDADLQRLRKANDTLRASNEALRQANQSGIGEPELVNQAMAAEIEGLRATRATELAEANAVLARLESLLAGTADLPEGEEH
ncbi:hypothetical protein [Pontibaca methylaminivorans]|uniref:hypothetical protein n=1 Tax=Pontibaca methylaminivorans TaxID=515897 RepID=UPI002FDB0F87